MSCVLAEPCDAIARTLQYLTGEIKRFVVKQGLSECDPIDPSVAKLSELRSKAEGHCS